MWLMYRNVHMQLKVKGMQLKAMQLKVSMEKNIGERGSTRAIYVHSLFSSFFYALGSYSLHLSHVDVHITAHHIYTLGI